MADTKELGLFIPPEKAAELQEREAIANELKGRITRRLAIRWLGWGTLLALLGQWTLGFVFGFFWPQKTGAFGGTVAAGRVDALEVGDVVTFRDGKFYLSRVPEGFLALWWKCPHLGCTVPWKPDDPAHGGPPGQGDLAFAEKGGFRCPCHGSIYNRYGQIISGPAPRPMDLFPIRIENGRILVDTGPNQAIIRSVAQPSDAVSA